MNQAIKNGIYRLATQDQVDYLAELAELTDLEKKILDLWHKGESDLNIQEETGLSAEAYSPVEKLIRTKMAVITLTCINRCKFEDKGRF